MKKIIAVLCFSSVGLLNHAAANCLITNAIYSYDSNPSVTARFQPLKHKSLTDVYFTITSSTGQNLWFTFDWGNGFNQERLVSSKTNPADDNWKPQDPDSDRDRAITDLSFFSFDQDLNVLESKFEMGATAPAFIFIPELAPTLWYARDKNLFEARLNRAMFRLRECKE